MALIDLSGSSTGAGLIPPVTPIKALVVAGSTDGVATTDAAVFRTIIVGGQVRGFGSLEDQLLIFVDGETIGAGDVQGTLTRTVVLRGQTTGLGTFFEIVPERLVGCGTLVATPVVDRIPCPVQCSRAGVPVLRWGQTLGPGDLLFAIRDVAGNPFAPIIVLYRLYQVLPGGGLLPVGDPNRRPAKCGQRLGVYYATGTVGECGQPGDWVIEWRWQRSTFAPTQVEQRRFRVLDAVLDTATPDGTCRVRKYGWGD